MDSFLDFNRPFDKPIKGSSKYNYISDRSQISNNLTDRTKHIKHNISDRDVLHAKSKSANISEVADKRNRGLKKSNEQSDLNPKRNPNHTRHTSRSHHTHHNHRSHYRQVHQTHHKSHRVKA